MILENNLPALAGKSVGIGDFVGEPQELIENTMESMVTIGNLNIAMARLEHHCIVESASPETLNEGIKEFFGRVKDTIVKYWKKFVNWISAAFESIRSKVFGPRTEWLKKNEAELVKLTSFGDAKYSFGSKVMAYSGTKFKEFAEKAQKALTLSNDVGDKVDREELKKKVEELYGRSGDKDGSLTKSLQDDIIGDEKEVAIDAAGVKAMIKVAHAAFKDMEDLPHAKQIADSFVKKAEGYTTVWANSKGRGDSQEDKDGKESLNRKLEALTTIGPVVQSSISAVISAVSKVNAQSMGYLVSALRAGKSHAISSKDEAAGILAAYM
jgi:hypothetical protein